MESRNKDHRNPTVRDLCLWIAQEALFIKPESLCKYVAGIRYYLDSYGKGHIARDVLVTRVVRGVCKKYGFGKQDLREPITVEMLVRVLRSVVIGNHNERCFAAACVIGF